MKIDLTGETERVLAFQAQMIAAMTDGMPALAKSWSAEQLGDYVAIGLDPLFRLTQPSPRRRPSNDNGKVRRRRD